MPSPRRGDMFIEVTNKIQHDANGIELRIKSLLPFSMFEGVLYLGGIDYLPGFLNRQFFKNLDGVVFNDFGNII